MTLLKVFVEVVVYHDWFHFTFLQVRLWMYHATYSLTVSAPLQRQLWYVFTIRRSCMSFNAQMPRGGVYTLYIIAIILALW